MQPIRRLNLLWTWLPAFRAVAETEHLPTASELLGVTPQALSHAVKRLEETAGKPLFERVGRRIQLNADGRIFLTHLRIAMRTVDEGLVALQESVASGPARIAAVAHDAWLYAEPAIRVLRESQPGLVPHVASLPWKEARSALMQGTIDVAIGESSEDEQALNVELLTTQRFSIFCGRGHPLYRRSPKGLRDVLTFAFVAPVEGVSDYWPVAMARKIGARVDSFQIALELCLSGSYLACLPDEVAQRKGSTAGLRRLDFDLGVEREVFLSYRRPVTTHRITEALVGAIRAFQDTRG